MDGAWDRYRCERIDGTSRDFAADRRVARRALADDEARVIRAAVARERTRPLATREPRGRGRFDEAACGGVVVCAAACYWSPVGCGRLIAARECDARFGW